MKEPQHREGGVAVCEILHGSDNATEPLVTAG